MEQVNFSAFSARDVEDIALQRTGQLKRLPGLGPVSFRAWERGHRLPLQIESRLRRRPILQGALDAVAREVEKITDYVGDRPVRRLVDIGCGHGLADLVFWRKYRCHIHLVDIERTDDKHHAYHSKGAGYASLKAARKFLMDNGVPASDIKTTNPRRDELVDGDVDLIVSMISAGFHYPISTYTDFAIRALRGGGALVFDARKKTGQEEALSGFARVDVIAEGPKHKKLAAIKG